MYNLMLEKDIEDNHNNKQAKLCEGSKKIIQKKRTKSQNPKEKPFHERLFT
jgi:hypothetical protein